MCIHIPPSVSTTDPYLYILICVPWVHAHGSVFEFLRHTVVISGDNRAGVMMLMCERAAFVHRAGGVYECPMRLTCLAVCQAMGMPNREGAYIDRIGW